MNDHKNLRIVFFGTPAFAEASLRVIHVAGYDIAAVVTAPDKPSGRGYRPQPSAVKKCALELGLHILQPERLRSPEFLEELRSLKADLQIVIAFRMLPEVVWSMPPLGTFNLHASYLPWYRGAAPINRVIMNGEKETGLTTFFLQHEIDTGSILLREKHAILPEDNAGSLHDRLMEKGADLVLRSLEKIKAGNYTLIPQEQGDFPHAPKIFTEDCRISWNRKAAEVNNQIRGLSPYPCAFTEFRNKGLKIFSARVTEEPSVQAGEFEMPGKGRLLVHCLDLKLELTEVQAEGKKRMPVRDFVNGIGTGSD